MSYEVLVGEYDAVEGATAVTIRFADAAGNTVWETTRNVASNDEAVLAEVSEEIVRDVLGTPALSVALADVPAPAVEVVAETATEAVTETTTEETGA